MSKKFIFLAAVCIFAAVIFTTCNIFPGEAYSERNANNSKVIALESPRVVLQREKLANPGKTVEQLMQPVSMPDGSVVRSPLDGSLNRLAFGVSSRTIKEGNLPVPVYRAVPSVVASLPPGTLPSLANGAVISDSQFRPWGNLVWDSDEQDEGLFGKNKDGQLENQDAPTFDKMPEKGAGRQIVLTAINETNNAGKIAGSEDGITYYFRRVPRDVNFRISADFYVDSYGFTGGRAELNGQEAFGFMARDWIPQHHDGRGYTGGVTPLRPGFDGEADPILDNVKNPEGIPSSGGAPYDLTEVGLKDIAWNGVYWNGQDTSLNDGVASSSNMIMVGGVKRGMRVYWRTGVTDPDFEKKPITDFNTIANADFAKFDYKPRELSDYSTYGSGISGTMARPDFPTAGLTYKLYLEKTDSGFIAKIEPPKGVGKGVTKTRVPSDGFTLEYSDRELPYPDLLCGPTSVERNHYYIGLFAARDAKVTVTNLKYEEYPSDITRRIDPEPEAVTATFQVQSPIATSSEDYTFYARSNVEGKLLLSLNGGETKAYETNDDNWIVEATNASAKPFALFKVEGLKLGTGDNIFDMVFLPDTKQLRSGFMGFDKNGKKLPLNEVEYLLVDTRSISRSFIVNRRSMSGADYFPLEGNDQDFYSQPNAPVNDRIRREVIWVAPDGKPTGSGSRENPLDLKTAIAVSSVVNNNGIKSGQVIMMKDGIYTPVDPPEVIDGGTRIPIRLVIPRYNSGKPNNDPGAPAEPQQRPGPEFPNASYPDPYADEYYRYFKVLKAENRDLAVIDFRKDLRTRGYAPRNMEVNGDYWIIDGIHVRNAEDTYGGLRTHGQNNLFRWIKTYFNGDSGLWVSGRSDEPKSMWPTNVRIEYCESFGNIDQARTNADGFAAKLTTWEGIVFYRCISHHNTDDGWDLFAKKETGPIGAVRIEQSFAYSNGRYLNDEVGRNYSDSLAKMNYSAGVGGNGFKMGGEGIPIPHLVIDSITWGNDGDGVTSNSDPAIRITHVSAFDNYNRIDTNPGSNFAIYSASSPSYEGLDAIITQVLSWRSSSLGSRNDRLEPKSPSSGFVWRNYIPAQNRGGDAGRLFEHEIYDANNGKDSSILEEFPTDENPNGVKYKQLPGRSVSTLFVVGKYPQDNLRWRDVPGYSHLTASVEKLNPNSSSVNDYRNNREFKVTDFSENPYTHFWYGNIDIATRNYNGGNRTIYTSNTASPWNVNPGDTPYRRLDGTTPKVESAAQSGVTVGLPNRPDGRIDGDFLNVYSEKDAPSAAGYSQGYFIGLPKIGKFMKLQEGNFPGTAPGARGLWAE